MALSKLLVAYDGSEAGASALNLASDIARDKPRREGGHCQRCRHSPAHRRTAHQLRFRARLMDRDAKELLGKAVDHLDEIGLENEVETFMLNGTDPAVEISKLADQEGYDMVVIGSRGLGGIKGYLGSVGHKLLSICSKPVLVAK